MGQPGRYVVEYKSLLEGEGGGIILTLFYKQRLRGWGIQKFVKDIRGFFC